MRRWRYQNFQLYRAKDGNFPVAVRLAVYGSIRADCTAGQLPSVRLSQNPEHGTITVKQARMRSTNFKNCLAVEAPVFVAIYRSTVGFSGQDLAALEVISSDGNKQLQRFKITIEKAPSNEKAPSSQGI